MKAYPVAPSVYVGSLHDKLHALEKRDVTEAFLAGAFATGCRQTKGSGGLRAGRSSHQWGWRAASGAFLLRKVAASGALLLRKVAASSGAIAALALVVVHGRAQGRAVDRKGSSSNGGSPGVRVSGAALLSRRSGGLAKGGSSGIPALTSSGPKQRQRLTSSGVPHPRRSSVPRPPKVGSSK